MVKQISHNEIYLLIKYIKGVLWRVAKRLSYIEDARCLKVNLTSENAYGIFKLKSLGYCWLTTLEADYTMYIISQCNFDIR